MTAVVRVDAPTSERAQHSPSPRPYGEKVGMRSGVKRRHLRLPLPLTLTLSPRSAAQRGEG
jgi:hypothetical protein